MSWWVWIVVYWIGAVATARFHVLRIQENVDRDKFYAHRTSWRDHPDSFAVIFTMMFWPLVAVAWLSYKAAFPRGVVSRYAKQRALEEKQQAQAKELKRMAAEIKELSKAADLKIPEGL